MSTDDKMKMICDNCKCKIPPQRQGKHFCSYECANGINPKFKSYRLDPHELRK
jgi:hypothetical protein